MNDKLFRYSDGGRINNGFTNERWDCTVRAYALAMNITYGESHRIFEQFGRKPRHTCKFHKFIRENHPEIFHINTIRPRPRVKTLLKKAILKNAIVRIKGHVFCVKNNIVLDIGECQNCIVIDIWYFN